MTETHEPGIVIVHLSDELFTRYLKALCHQFGWTLRHPDMNATVHWVTVPAGHEHGVIKKLHHYRWVTRVRRSTKLRRVL